jgi:hypothetical protein
VANIKRDTLLTFYFEHYIHQDKLIWDRIPQLITLNALTWGGLYFLTEEQKSVALFSLAAIAIFFKSVLYISVKGAMENRFVNHSLFQEIVKGSVEEELFAKISNYAEKKEADKDSFILLAETVKKRSLLTRITARRLFLWSFLISIAVDVAIVLYYLYPVYCS